MRKVVPAITALLLALLSGCAGMTGGNSVSSVSDTTPPAKVSSFSAAQDDGKIVLSWNAPGSPDYMGALVRRGTAGYPVSPAAPDTDDDKIVYRGSNTSYTDTGLRHGKTYYYGAFSYDEVPNYSPAARVSAESIYATFTFIAIPDTQYLSLGLPALFDTTIQWIADNADGENTVFVLHEGDITHNNTDDEWANAAASMGILDGVVPYALAVGNHDMDGGDTSKFNQYFPVSKYESLPTFGGVCESGKLDNSFHLFSAGGTDWMAVSLEYDPPDEVLDWASQVAEAHPDRRVIVVTHAYLNHTNERTSIGENIWNKFVKKHANMLFVFNGHYTTGEAGRLVSDGDNGNKVYQMFANYQTRRAGGLGYLRIVKLNPSTGGVSVKTYSPYAQDYETDPDNEFEFEDVDFGPLESGG
ncbi:MAG: metallophosphoesterase [bacterium]